MPNRVEPREQMPLVPMLICGDAWLFCFLEHVDYLPMNSKHRRALSAIFENPVSANIAWADIESLLAALGAEISEGRGSRVRIALNGVRAVFHRPHPQKEASRGAVTSMRRFLLEAGVEPEVQT